MKTLEIVKLNVQDLPTAYADWRNAMESFPWNDIDVAPWASEFPYVPAVRFQVAYDNKHIILHYDVQEEFVKGQFIRPNENVWEDSCVEFFISFDQRKTYYNVEFNVLGVGLIGYGGAVKAERNRLSAEQILSVNTASSVQTIQGKKSWQQVLVIPFEILGVNAEDLAGQSAAANFYKCGDGLPNPHFIAWNGIDHPTPNFHLPQFFGEVKFQ